MPSLGKAVEIGEVPAAADGIPSLVVRVGIQDTATDYGRTPRPAPP